MSYRQRLIEINQPAHILSRAVEGIKIFKRKNDCYRFVFQIYAANFGSPGPNLSRRNIQKAGQALLHGRNIAENLVINIHSPLVHILDFALVMNHFHFYLMPNAESGVSFFMQKLKAGFAKYFNLKYHRRDALFGSRYKSILVKTNFQSDAVSRYISIINPLDIYKPGWRVGGLKDWKQALKFLKNYEFSSFPDKIGVRSSNILAPKQILEKYSFMSRPEKELEYLNFAKDFLKQKLNSFQTLLIE